MKSKFLSLLIFLTACNLLSGQDAQAVLDSVLSNYSKFESLSTHFVYSSIRSDEKKERYRGAYYLNRDGRVHFHIRSGDDDFVASYLIESNDSLGEFYGRMIDTSMELVGRNEILGDAGGMAGAGIGVQSEIFYHSKIRAPKNFSLGTIRDTLIEEKTFIILPIQIIHIYTDEEKKELLERMEKTKQEHPNLPFPDVKPPQKTVIIKNYIIDPSDYSISYVMETFQQDNKSPLKSILEYKNVINSKTQNEDWDNIKTNFRIN